MSDYTEDKVQRHRFNIAPWTAPSTMYVALTTTTPTDSTPGTEVTTGGYARVAVTSNGTNWNIDANNRVTNAVAVNFPTLSAQVVVVGFELYDAASSGNRMDWGVLDSPKTVAASTAPSFAIGDLKFDLD